MTTEIVSTNYRGIKLQAIGANGCKYSLTAIEFSGKKWNTGYKTVKDADEYFATHDEVEQMVLYIYHPKKHTFEVCKYYERSMNKQQSELADKIKLTKEQTDAIAELNVAFEKCGELGLDFVYDRGISRLVAVNLNNAEMHYCEENCVHDDNSIIFDQIGTSILPDIDIDEVMCEVGSQTYYNDEYDRICFTPKMNE